MTKRKLTYFIASILVITLILMGVGLFFNKSEVEKRHGLTNLFDVNQDGEIAFVYENHGKQEIYLQKDQKQEKALQLDEDARISSIHFSPDGTDLVYSLINTEKERSAVHVLDTISFDIKELFQDDGLITEIVYHPDNENRLFYLKAMTFEHYSPIASARPHDMDVFGYNIKQEKETRYTNLKAYSIASLQPSNDGSAVYAQLFDDEDVDTAEDSFDAKQKVFYIPLDQPTKKKIVSDPARTIDIYDFALMPDEEAMVFQSISNEAAGETYQYDLYYYDFQTKGEKQLTDLESYAEHPIVGPDGNTIYFIVNDKFAKEYPENHLYKMKLDQNNEGTPTEINLDIEV